MLLTGVREKDIHAKSKLLTPKATLPLGFAKSHNRASIRNNGESNVLLCSFESIHFFNGIFFNKFEKRIAACSIGSVWAKVFSSRSIASRGRWLCTYSMASNNTFTAAQGGLIALY